MQEMKETRARSLCQEDPLEESMATPSSILAWRIPWTEEPGRLGSIGSRRAGCGWSDLACMHISQSITSLSPLCLTSIHLLSVFPTSTVEWVVKSPGSGMSEFQCSSSLVIWLRIALLPTFGFLFHKWGQFWDLCPHIKLSRAGWDSAGQVLSLIFNTPAVHSQLCLSFLQASIEQNKTEVPQSEMLVAGGLS